MGLISYTQLEDNTDANANVFNERFGRIIDEINGNIDTINLKDGAVTTAKLAAGAVTSEKLGFEQYVDANGWSITDLGLVKLAAKRRTFKVPSYAQDSGGFATLDAGMDNSPVGFNPAAAHRVIHQPYMLGIVHAVQGWDLKMKEEDGIGFMKPGTKVVASRVYGGTSAPNELGAVETWVIF